MYGESEARQARVRHNDHGTLHPPEVAAWRPRRTVSVIVPAHGAARELPLTLAALAAQSYPQELMEVIVVDDGCDPPLRLPEIAPRNTKLIKSGPEGWGGGHARHQGVLASDGEVIHWLDSDMLPYREHVEAQLRWHELADHLVVLGYKRFVDFTPGHTPEQVRDAVAAGDAGGLFDLAASTPHEWVDRVLDRTDGLRTAGHLAYQVHVTATASVTRALYDDAGGIDTSLQRGVDTELGYRLAQAGAVFVPEPLAESWHLGPTTIMRLGEPATRYNGPFLANRLPQPRRRRTEPGRTYPLPYVEAVVDATEATYEDASATVDGVLGGIVGDVRVMLRGPWSALTEERQSPLADPLLDLRLLRAAYESDPRVRLVETVDPCPGLVPFRFTCPAGWAPTPNALVRITERMDRDQSGVMCLALPVAPVLAARMERTAAFRRARRVALPGEDIDDVVHQLFGVHWEEAAAWGVRPAGPPRREAPRDWRAEAERAEAEAAELRAEAARLRAEIARRRAAPAGGPRHTWFGARRGVDPVRRGRRGR